MASDMYIRYICTHGFLFAAILSFFLICVCCLCYYVVVVIFANGIRCVTTMYTTRVDQAITNDDQVW